MATYSNDQIKSYIDQIYASGGTDAQVKAAMNQFGISSAQVAAAYGVPEQQVQAAYDAATPSYQDIVNQAYASLGRSGIGTNPNQIDQAGYDYWLGQLERGAVTPENFAANFNYAVSQAPTGYTPPPITTTLPSPVDETGMTKTVGVGTATGPSASSGTDYSKLVMDAYARYGRSGGIGGAANQIDPEGFNYWIGQLQSGAILPENFNSVFNYSAQDFINQNPNSPYVQNYYDYLASQQVVPGSKLPNVNLSAPVTGEGITTQFIREAPEIEAYKLGLLQEAQRLYGQPIDYSKLTYQVAPTSAMTLGSYDIAQQGIGAYQPFVQQGAETLAQGQGIASQAQQLGQLGLGAYLSATGQYAPGQAAAFMNPYQQLVTNEALREIRRQADIAGQGQAAQAVKAGAFGSTREGVQRAEMERNTQDIMSQRIAQDLAQNYAQAQQASQAAYEAQQQRALAAGQGIGGLTSTYGSLGGQLGQLGVQQAALGQAAQQGMLSDVNLMNVLGQQQQAQQQAALEAQRMSNYQQAFDPYTRLGFVSDIYKGAPSTQSAITATTAQQPSAFQQLVGGVTSGIATAAGAQKLGLF